MNCAECKEILVAYLEGLLAEAEKQAVAEHLKDCSACQAEVKQLTNLRDRLIDNGKVLAQSDLENEVLNRIVREQNVRLKAADKAGAALRLRRMIMRSPITKLAAAAAIIIAVLIGIHQFGKGTVTFADVVEPILNARTMIYDFLVGDEATSPIMHDIIVEQRIRRTISNIPGMTHIIDLESSQMLVLIDEDKMAAYVDIQGPLQDRTQNYVKFLRRVITQLQDNYEELGEQQIHGQKAIGFEASGPNEGVRIWADPETALPIRIELRLGKMFVILKNFQFDASIDDSLMSMDVPPGYTLKETDFDLASANEQDFIESLRIWAEVILEGTFPEVIGTANAMKAVPLLGEKLGQMNLPEDEATQLGMSFGRGMLFHQILETQGRWQYTGGGVQLGNADKVIFRYQPEGSETWRVVYGDLRVEDVPSDKLPQ
jgi:outer membrane lipoprotein-sorting protein